MRKLTSAGTAEPVSLLASSGRVPEESALKTSDVLAFAATAGEQLVNRGHFGELTSAPSAGTSWAMELPTPPLAECTSTLSPGRNRA